MIHLARDGTQLGQFTPEQVQSMLAAGQIRPTDLSWKEGLSGWIPLGEMEGFHAGAALQPAATPAGLGASPTAVSAYAPPRASLGPVGGSQGVSAQTVLLMQQTRPWVLLLGVIGMIVSVLMLLGGLGMMTLGAFATSGSSTPAAASVGLLAGMAVMYAILAFLYIYPSLKLIRYAGAIGRLTRSGRLADLEAALLEQKSFWKYTGMLMLLMIIAYIAVIAIAGVGIFTAGMSGMSAP